MTLNERAAKCLKLRKVWGRTGEAFYVLPSGCRFCGVKRWNPAGDPANANDRGDYNHAYMLYWRVVEMGLNAEFLSRLRAAAPFGISASACLAAGLTRSPTELTELCCEVLEANSECGLLHPRPAPTPRR